MKWPFAIVIALPVALIAGCVHPSLSHPIVLDRVGPPAVNNAEGTGSLLVFSQSSVDMPDNTLATRRVHYSDYKIFSDNGQLLRTIHNNYDNDWEGPREVDLAPGKYHIVAQAAKYGTVTVPVLIAAHQITRVNLTGTPLVTDKELSDDKDVVCLPNGEIVGQFAHKEASPPLPLAKDNRK